MSRRWKVALSLFVSVAGLWWVFQGVDRDQLAGAFRDMRRPWWLAALPLALCLEYWARALRWAMLLPGRPLSVKRAFAVTAGGFFLNNVLPLRAGEAARLLWTCRDAGASLPFVGAVLAADRLLDVLALASLALAVIGWGGFPGGGRAAVLTGAAALAGCVALWALARFPEKSAALASRWGLPERMRVWMTEASHGAAALAQPGRFLFLYALSFSFWLMNAGLLSALSRMFELNLTPLEGMGLLTAFAFGAALPSAPGYIGTLEAAGVALLQALGRLPAQALPFILTFHVGQILASSFFGIPALAVLGRSSAHAR